MEVYIMLEKYLSKVNFNSYDDFVQNFKLNIPEISILLMMLPTKLQTKLLKSGISLV